MLKVILFCILTSVVLSVNAQVQTQVIGDSVFMHSNAGKGELILQNSTDSVNGFLFNKGAGRTEFRKVLIKINDSTYLVGADTLHLNGGSGNAWSLPALTSGSVLFSNGSTIAQDNANFFWNNSAKRLGIGTNAPSAALQVGNSTNNVTVSNTGVLSFNGTGVMSIPLNKYAFNVVGYPLAGLYFNGSTSAGIEVRDVDGSIKGRFGVGTTSSYIMQHTGIGLSTPTALLHLAAGTASANSAPLKFTAGTNLITPENGAIEFNGSHFYATIGSTRYQLDQQASGADSSVYSSLTSGSVLFSNGTSLSEDNAHFFWDQTNSKLGIGGRPTAALTHALQVNGTIGGMTFSGTYLNVSNGQATLAGNNGIRFQSNIYITNTNNLGIGLAFPTAKLNITGSSGDAGTAPLKLNPGIKLTIPEVGAIENDSAANHLYWTDILGRRYQLDNQQAFYSPPVATTTSAGVVSVGSGLVIDSTGKLSTLTGLFKPGSVPYAATGGTLKQDTTGLVYDGNNLQVGHSDFYNTTGLSLNGGRGYLGASGFGLTIKTNGGEPMDASKSISFYNSSTRYGVMSMRSTSDSMFRFLSDMEIVPSANNKYNLGSSSNQWDTVFAKQVYVNGALVGGGGTPSLDAVTAVGSSSSRDITINGVIVGRGPGVNPSYAAQNTVLGNGAYTSNTTGRGNTAIGASALVSGGSGNTAIGYQAMSTTPAPASSNTAVGAFSMLNSGANISENTSVGYSSLEYGNNRYNTAIGSYAMQNTSIGSDNTAVGRYSMVQNSNGSFNSSLGSGAFSNNISGSHNVSIGSYSGVGLSSGSYNVIIGDSSMFTSAVSGAYNTSLGHKSNFANDFNNTTSLGANSQPTQSNQVVLGDNSVTQVLTYGNVLSKVHSSSSDPTTTDIPTGFTSVWTNTTSGNTYLWANIGGTLLKTELQ